MRSRAAVHSPQAGGVVLYTTIATPTVTAVVRTERNTLSEKWWSNNPGRYIHGSSAAKIAVTTFESFKLVLILQTFERQKKVFLKT